MKMAIQKHKRILIILQVVLLTLANFTETDASDSSDHLEESIPPPKAPKTPNCGSSFPGTPNWNACWERFREDMSSFQNQMQEFGTRVSQMAAKNGAKSGFSSLSSTNCLGSANCVSSTVVNGYAVHASGISVSAVSRDSTIQIKLTVGNFESFESMMDRNEIELRFKNRGQQKWAKIRVPEGVKLIDLKIERSLDTIMITGPLKAGFGNKGTSATVINDGHFPMSQHMNFPMMQPGFPFMNPMNMGVFPQHFPGALPARHAPPQMWLF